MKKNIYRLAATLVLAYATAASAVDIPIDPRSTFLRTNDDTPQLPLVLSLASLGLSGGSTITLSSVGDYSRGSGYTDTFNDLIAVFSSSSIILPTGNLNRIPGAIDAGVDVFTADTYYGGFNTDISQDFDISATTTATIPIGATFLMVGTSDVLFFDNTDPNGNFGVRISAVPEPATVLMFATGFLLLRRYLR